MIIKLKTLQQANTADMNTVILVLQSFVLWICAIIYVYAKKKKIFWLNAGKEVQKFIITAILLESVNDVCSMRIISVSFSAGGTQTMWHLHH